MKSETTEDVILDLLWGAWTELGAPGVGRRYQKVAVDPEPLIVFTPALVDNDPRLVEQATMWCERHGGVISKTRLDGLLRQVPDLVGAAFVAFAEPLGGAAASWQPAKKGTRRSSQSVPSAPPPLDRRALARLRMRALAGTGARADVLCELLGSEHRWTSATDLEHLGYTRRYIADVLSDLTAARLTAEKPAKGAAAFRLRDPRALATLIDANELTWPDWTPALTLGWRLAQLEKSVGRSTVVAPVKVRDAWDELRRLSLAAGMQEPPNPHGEGVWSTVLQWGSAELRRWPHESS